MLTILMNSKKFFSCWTDTAQEDCSHCIKPPPRSSKKRLTPLEAFNSGKLLQYLFCNEYAQRGEYEDSWAGHQPLTPETWGDGRGGCVVSPAELRRDRGRRRRGVYSSPDVPSSLKCDYFGRKSGTAGTTTTAASVTPGDEWSVLYPKDLDDPHLRGWKCSGGQGGGLGVPELD